MKPFFSIAALALAALPLAGCVEVDTGGDDGLSGTADQFARMEGPCVSQAARMTGAPGDQVAILERIRTGGGPILTLQAAGAKYTCRLEGDGSVTVFSEFAN